MLRTELSVFVKSVASERTASHRTSAQLDQKMGGEFLASPRCDGCSFEEANLLTGKCDLPINNNVYILMSLIEIIIRAQCSISDPCRRVKSIANQNAKEFLEDEYDFIVVGGGVAGSVLAARLSENPQDKVLLLEAGAEAPTVTSVPAFWNTATNTSYDWQYQTVPQKRACLSNNGVCLWPRGKMLCGTACLSGLMYTRGHPSVYDSWAKDNPGWSYADLMEYFKKSERNSEPSNEIDREYHGFDGPMSVSRFPFLPDLADNILKGAKEMGMRYGDPNGRHQETFTIAPIMTENGEMASPYKMYLRPALKRPNLRVLLEAHVVRINFDNSASRATGVEFQDKWGKVRKMKARKEVILSGGVVGSAQLLQLSGIGPKEDLERLRIKVVRNLPVGKNLHYHVGYGVTMRMEGKNTNGLTNETLHDFLSRRDGPFTSTGLTQLTGFYASKYAKNKVPDIQFYLDGYTPKCRTRENLREKSDISFRPIYLLSKCRGTLKIRSTDPTAKPLIDPNYLCDEVEVKALLESVEVVYNLTRTKPMRECVRQFDIAENKRCAHLRRKSSTEYWTCVIKEYTNGENHHAGTCKMGPAGDPTAVVDHQLRVHGIPNLRVADASIFPTPINCNTIAPVIMIGEKASHMIQSTWNSHSKSSYDSPNKPPCDSQYD